jgi:hypothetical protein
MCNIDRILSAYMYLIKNPQQTEVGRNKLRAVNASIEWESFWKAIIANNGMRDIHWRPQVTITYSVYIVLLLFIYS